MKYLALLLLISCEASGQKDLRGPDSTSYTLIRADNCMCQEPQYFFTMKTPKGDTVKLDMLVFWDLPSSFWRIKTGEDKIRKMLKRGKRFWMKDDIYLFNEDYIFKIYKH